jgi:hypothetical protein
MAAPPRPSSRAVPVTFGWRTECGRAR